MSGFAPQGDSKTYPRSRIGDRNEERSGVLGTSRSSAAGGDGGRVGNCSGRQYFAKAGDGSRISANLTELRNPDATPATGDKSRNETRRSGNISPRSWPPPSATTVAVAKVTTVALAQPEKRGRAQKKRARKIKEKMRQLCVDTAAVAAIATADTRTPAVGIPARGDTLSSPNVAWRSTATSQQQPMALSRGGRCHAGAGPVLSSIYYFFGLEQQFTHPWCTASSLGSEFVDVATCHPDIVYVFSPPAVSLAFSLPPSVVV